MALYGPEIFQLKNGETVVIRHCSPSDAERFPEFQEQIARETTHTLQVAGELSPLEKVRAAWLASELDPKSIRLGVFAAHKLIGQLSLSPTNSSHPWVQHVGSFGMMILEKYWGQGIGKRLLKIMEEHALAQGLTRIQGLVRTENQPGIKLYTKSGYKIEGLRQNAAYINGRYENEFYLCKVLSPPAAGNLWQPPQLETDRLILRALVETDAEAIFSYAQNSEVSRYTMWDPHLTLKDSFDFIVNYAKPLYRNQVPEPFGITLRENPEKVIGTVGCFWVSQQSQIMELAYAFGKSYWGRGYATEASYTVLKFCFENYQVQRIQARCKVENIPSARMMEKLGMNYEGTLRSSVFNKNRFWDVKYYSILKNKI